MPAEVLGTQTGGVVETQSRGSVELQASQVATVVRVQAVSSGYYGGQLYFPGDVFDLASAGDFSNSALNYAGPGANTVQFGWMKQVSNSTPLFTWLQANNAPYLPLQDPSRRFIY
jgi:hypothetical protein